MTDRIRLERERLTAALEDPEMRRDGKLWCYLWTARQALSWTLDPEAAAAPFGVITGGGVQPLSPAWGAEGLAPWITRQP